MILYDQQPINDINGKVKPNVNHWGIDIHGIAPCGSSKRSALLCDVACQVPIPAECYLGDVTKNEKW